MEKLSRILTDTLIPRIVIAAVLLAVSFLPIIPDSVELILLIFSVLIAGLDLLLNMISALLEGRYADLDLTFLGATILLIFSYQREAALVCILSQVFALVFKKLHETIQDYEIKQLDAVHPDRTATLYEIYDQKNATDLMMKESVIKTVLPSMAGILIAALLYVVLMPLLKHLTVSVCVYRAVSMLLVSAPCAMVRSFPAIGTVALGNCASLGLFIPKASDLEQVIDAKVAVLDSDFKTRQHYEILYLESPFMEEDSFCNFLYHMVHDSKQQFAFAFRSLFQYDYDPSVITNSMDIPGYGIRAEVSGQPVLLGKSVLCEKFGYDLSSFPNIPEQGTAYFLCLGDRCIGCIVLALVPDIDTEDIISSFDNFHIRCFYSDQEESQKVTKRKKVSIYYPENKNVCASDLNYAVSADFDHDSSCILPTDTDNIGLIPFKSQRITELAKSNSIFSFAGKILVVVASILGFCTPAIAILVECAFSVATIVDSLHYTGTPILRFPQKTGDS